ncbi:AAA family ATPase [Pseudoalteromonas sp. HL-AS2]|uniref:AAA family ATPase n=1 Tax=Pseudoalteromonas sp. HL-AS2 TaxID=3071082 RepID=UPI0028152051|nr:AAA family ATPase [Pseudoalteromonas sp. HL-AS2]WMS93332.1 AAA family ATPase [Pseudoalteromonas sp. HL-AS2]
MAKNKNKSNTNSTIPSKASSKNNQVSGAIKGLLSKAGIELDSGLENKLNAEQEMQLSELITNLTMSIDTNEKKQTELTTKQQVLTKGIDELEDRKKRVLAQDKEVTQLQNDIQKKSTSLLQREMECANIEADLMEREANAEAGFVIERQASLTTHKEALIRLDQELKDLEQQKIKTDVDLITEQRQQANEFEQLMQSKLAKEVQLLNDEKASFEQLQRKLKEDYIELNTAKEKFSIKLASQKRETQALRDELTNDFELEQQLLTQKLESLETFRQRDLEKVKALQNKIEGFNELEREAKMREFAHPSDVLEHLDSVEQELKEARSKLKGRDETDLEEELEYFKEIAEEKTESLERMRQDLDEAQAKARKNQLSIRDKLELQAQNDTLELHNQTLKVSIDSLKATLDDLIDKQQSQQAFSELTKMDRKYAEPTATTSISSLGEFSDELQHRIATAEKGVTLYYDMNVLRKFVAGLAMSQLHVFEGISGTGKTSLVKAFAKAVGGHVTTVPVQAGWRDRDDLLGHYNAFEKRYYEKECLQGLYQGHTPSFKNRFNIVLLDEMNLSRPEQYFAEFLSAIEMREGERNIVLMDSSVTQPPKHFVEERKIPLGNNTWFMGTANHDETTFEFADKTHDRSFMMELKRQQKPNNWRPKKVPKDIIDIASVISLFDDAQSTHKTDVDKLLTTLKESEFTKVLENDFGIGWGNRFETQAQRFIAVYIECGGEAIEALEHLLITRVLRKGKVLGRFDISQTKLEKLHEALEKLLGNKCNESSDILQTETELKEEGAF